MNKVIGRLIATKFMNMGQTCIAPDYVVVHDDDYDIFLNQLINTIDKTYGKTLMISLIQRAWDV